MAPVGQLQRNSLSRHRKWCFCVDFRIGTIALSVGQIILHLACMAFLMAVFLRPSLMHDIIQQMHQMEHYHSNDVQQQPQDPAVPPQGSSLHHTFHMLIFGSQQDVLAKDKDGKVHLTRMYQPLLVAAIPQDGDNSDQGKPKVGQEAVPNSPFNMIQAALSADAPSAVEGVPHSGKVVVEAAKDSDSKESAPQQEEVGTSQDRVPHIRRVEMEQSGGQASEESQGQYELNCYHKGHHVLVLLCFWLSLCVCCCLLYGATMRRPLFLLPYLGVQIACFVFYLLALVHSLSYVPNLKFWVAHKAHLPFKEYLMQLSELHLTLLFISVSLSILLVKMNLLLLVWGCYRMLRMEQLQEAIARFQRQRSTANAAPAVNVVIDVPALIFLDEKSGDLEKSEGEQPPSYFQQTEEEKPVEEQKEADDTPLLSV